MAMQFVVGLNELFSHAQPTKPVANQTTTPAGVDGSFAATIEYLQGPPNKPGQNHSLKPAAC